MKRFGWIICGACIFCFLLIGGTSLWEKSVHRQEVAVEKKAAKHVDPLLGARGILHVVIPLPEDYYGPIFVSANPNVSESTAKDWKKIYLREKHQWDTAGEPYKETSGK